MVFASHYINIISYLLKVKIYTDSNTHTKKVRRWGRERKTLDKKQMRIYG